MTGHNCQELQDRNAVYENYYEIERFSNGEWNLQRVIGKHSRYEMVLRDIYYCPFCGERTKIKGLYYIVILPDDTKVHITSRESLNVGDQIYLSFQEKTYNIVKKYHEFEDKDRSLPPRTDRVFLYMEELQ